MKIFYKNSKIKINYFMPTIVINTINTHNHKLHLQIQTLQTIKTDILMLYGYVNVDM